MLSEILSIVGLGNSYISGVKLGKQIDQLIHHSKRIDSTIEKISEHIFYASDIQEVFHDRQKKVSDLRLVRESLEPLQKMTEAKLLSTAMITTSEELKKVFKKDPFEVLDFVRPLNRVKNHPNPDMVPLVFDDHNVKYVGWIMKGLMPVVFGLDYTESNDILVRREGVIGAGKKDVLTKEGRAYQQSSQPNSKLKKEEISSDLIKRKIYPSVMVKGTIADWKFGYHRNLTAETSKNLITYFRKRNELESVVSSVFLTKSLHKFLIYFQVKTEKVPVDIFQYLGIYCSLEVLDSQIVDLYILDENYYLLGFIKMDTVNSRFWTEKTSGKQILLNDQIIMTMDSMSNSCLPIRRLIDELIEKHDFKNKDAVLAVKSFFIQKSNSNYGEKNK